MDTGDTKRGTFIAQDRYGNKYYENLEEDLPCRFRFRTDISDNTMLSMNSANTMGRLQRP